MVNDLEFELDARDGSAEFKGEVKVGGNSITPSGATPAILQSVPDGGNVFGQVLLQAGYEADDGNALIIQRRNSGNTAWDIQARIKTDGNAFFEGTVTADGKVLTRDVTLRLDADDPNAYETRQEQFTEIETYKGPRGNELLTREVTKTREVTEYVGETMDVKSVLLKLTGALETLKTAAASATTCEELRTAIETALADV